MQTEEFQISDNYSYHSVQYQCLTPKSYQDLIESQRAARKFVSELGDLSEKSLPESLATYCQKASVQISSSQAVLDLVDSRLNKMIKNNRLKKNWSEDDIALLVWFVGKYMQQRDIQSHEFLNRKDWNTIAAVIPGATAKSCLFKFVSLKKFRLAQHKWQKEQEKILFSIVSQLGTSNWKNIAEKLYENSPKKKIFRTAKQCREHWSCYLSPQLKKGPWDRQEDRKLLKIVLQRDCQKKWSIIKEEFRGRTQNALKNRYNLLIEKQRRQSEFTNEIELIIENLNQEQTEKQQENQRGAQQNCQNITKKASSLSQSEQDIVIQTEAKISTRTEGSVPLVPQQHRNVNVPYNPKGFIVFYNGTEGMNMPHWFFPI